MYLFNEQGGPAGKQNMSTENRACSWKTDDNSWQTEYVYRKQGVSAGKQMIISGKQYMSTENRACQLENR